MILGDVYEAGEQLLALDADVFSWSCETYGGHLERGPVGRLQELEARAADAQFSPSDHYWYANLLILLLDAARRAGLPPLDLIDAARERLRVIHPHSQTPRSPNS